MIQPGGRVAPKILVFGGAQEEKSPAEEVKAATGGSRGSLGEV